MEFLDFSTITYYIENMHDRSKQSIPLYVSGIGFHPVSSRSILILQDLEEARTVAIPMNRLEAQMLTSQMQGENPPLEIYGHFSSLLDDQGYRVEEISYVCEDQSFLLRLKKGRRKRLFRLGPCEAVILSMNTGFDLMISPDVFPENTSQWLLSGISELVSFSEFLDISPASGGNSYF